MKEIWTEKGRNSLEVLFRNLPPGTEEDNDNSETSLCLGRSWNAAPHK
jgi:hypothetical protein